jgi:hypothetical protein
MLKPDRFQKPVRFGIHQIIKFCNFKLLKTIVFMNFRNLYLNMFIKPQTTFSLLFENSNKLRYAFYAFLVPSLGYTAFYIMAYLAGGSPSTFKPWLALPIEQYFKYDIFLTIPGYYLSWIGASATVYLVSKLLYKNAEFDNILVIIGFGLGVATWSSLLHDLTDAVLSVTGVIDMKEYERLLNEPTFWRYMLLTLYTIYFFWFTALFAIGLKIANKFHILKAVAIALVGLLTFQVILLIFIR